MNQPASEMLTESFLGEPPPHPSPGDCERSLIIVTTPSPHFYCPFPARVCVWYFVVAMCIMLKFGIKSMHNWFFEVKTFGL